MRDHVWDPRVVDPQPGVMPLVRRVAELDALSGAPTPALPAPQHLEAAAREADARAKGAAKGATATATGGVGTGSAEAARQTAAGPPVDAAFAIDWTSLVLVLGTLALIALAIWLAWRAGWHRRAASALREAAANAEARARARALAPVPAAGEGEWTQAAHETVETPS